MAGFCECCGQELATTKETKTLAGGRLTVSMGLITLDGETVPIQKQLRTVAYLLASKVGQLVTKDRILDFIMTGRPNEDAPGIKIIDVAVSNLRKRIRDNNLPIRIDTVFGDGYRMVEVADVESEAA